MKLSDNSINTNPILSDLEHIKDWLIKEDKELNEGFYCNWNKIEKSFQNNKLITLQVNENTIGFIVWSSSSICADIDILEIKPEYRKKGFGKIFFEQVSNYFLNEGYLVIKLFCSPKESEGFWKNMGFKKFPDLDYYTELTYYKTLIDVAQVTEIDIENKLELWNVEPHEKDKNLPKWRWEFNDKLIKPIIQPCSFDWYLRWTKKDKVIKEGKVKHFNSEENTIDFSPFMYFENLIEPKE
jgi:GNAT superfamily N-acetyltransferase